MTGQYSDSPAADLLRGAFAFTMRDVILIDGDGH